MYRALVTFITVSLRKLMLCIITNNKRDRVRTTIQFLNWLSYRNKQEMISLVTISFASSVIRAPFRSVSFNNNRDKGTNEKGAWSCEVFVYFRGKISIDFCHASYLGQVSRGLLDVSSAVVVVWEFSTDRKQWVGSLNRSFAFWIYHLPTEL